MCKNGFAKMDSQNRQSARSCFFSFEVVIMNTTMMKNSISDLIANPTIHPYLFRTRLERNLIRISKYALETSQTALYDQAMYTLEKMHSIVDKSNTTEDGTLLSYNLLQGDLKTIMSFLP